MIDKDLLSAEKLFDLALYEHRDLFLDSLYAWNALDKIKGYLQEIDLGAIQGDVSPQAHLVYPELISIGIGTVIEPGAYIKGPCIIGNYCTIRHGAYIRGDCIIGDHCVIGHATEVKGSIFLNHAHAAHFSYVGDSILGSHTNLGAGAKLANLLFTKEPISLNMQTEKIKTERRKLGAILGDYAQVGCNSVTNPGTVMGRRSCIYPSMNVGGYIPEDYSVKTVNERVSYRTKNYALN